MKKYHKDAYRAHELDAEQISMEQFAAQRAPVGKLIAHHLVRKIPPYEQTRKETSYGQHHLSRYKVEEIKQRTVTYFKKIPLAERQ